LLVALVVYVGFAVRTDSLLQGDQPHYALEAYSIADDGDRNLEDDYRDMALVQRVWNQPTFLPQAYHYRPGGPLVSWHAPGLAVLLAPAAGFGKTVEAMEIEMAAIAAIGAWLLFGILARLVPGRAWLRWTIWAGVVFALPVLGYANQLFPDLPAAVLVLAVVRILVARRVGVPGALAASACAAALPWLHVRFWLVAVALALAIAVRAIADADGRGRSLSAAGAVVVPMALSLALTAVANQAWYGSPSLTAASHPPVFRVASADRAPPGQRAQRTSTMDLGEALSASPDRLYRGVGRSLFSARSGWLPYVPVAVLGVAAALALAVRGNRWMAYGLLVALAYLVQLAVAGTLPGYVIPGRFELVLAPVVALPLLLAADRLRWLRVAVMPLVVLGIAVALGARMHIGALYPPGDAATKPSFSGAWVLAPWPTVTRQQPPAPSSVTVGRDREVPAGHRGVIARVRPPRSVSGDQVIVAALAREQPAAASRAVADISVVIDGVPAVRHAVTAGELPDRGGLRGIPVRASVAGGQRVEVVLRTTGAVPLRAAGVQLSEPSLGDTGLSERGGRYPDAPLVALWTAGVLLLAGLMVWSLRTLRSRARRPQPDLPGAR